MKDSSSHSADEIYEWAWDELNDRVYDLGEMDPESTVGHAIRLEMSVFERILWRHSSYVGF